MNCKIYKGCSYIYTETKLVEALDKTNASDMQTFNPLIKQLHTNLQGIKTDKIHGKKAIRKKTKLTFCGISSN